MPDDGDIEDTVSRGRPGVPRRAVDAAAVGAFKLSAKLATTTTRTGRNINAFIEATAVQGGIYRGNSCTNWHNPTRLLFK